MQVHNVLGRRSGRRSTILLQTVDELPCKVHAVVNVVTASAPLELPLHIFRLDRFVASALRQLAPTARPRNTVNNARRGDGIDECLLAAICETKSRRLSPKNFTKLPSPKLTYSQDGSENTLVGIRVNGTIPAVHLELCLTLVDGHAHATANGVDHVRVEGTQLPLAVAQEGYLVAIGLICGRIDVQQFGIVFACSQ